MEATVKGSFNKTTLIRLLKGGLGTPVLILAALAMVVLPMPSWLLDIFFVFNIAISIVVLMVSILTKKPLEFASFPSILLIATLLRLALNIASTRVVLINGHEGDDAAGQVIKSFGDVVIGGNYVVGLIVFIILMVINFVVITKGAGRISEVSARFTLDAMPGKQMAIDADLNAGLIDQDQARKRRREVAAEAEFYGSMDGASKFVKGDAIAGLIIMAINIIGGMIVGIGQHDLLFADATQIYTKLTIGDGLVAQIPSLLLSVSTAIIVTRQNEEQEMRSAVDVGDEITTIGGICGRVVTVKEEHLIIETGADRNRMQITRWAIQQNNTANERLAAERAAAKEAAEKAKAEKLAAKGKKPKEKKSKKED